MRHSESHIRTERLWLRQIDESDTETVVRLRSDPAVYRYFASPHRLTNAEHLAWYRGSYRSNDNRIDWIAVEDITGRVVGLYGAKRNASCVEVSYLTAPDAQGRGYAAEAVSAVSDWAKRMWQANSAIAVIHAENASSIRFAERLGFEPRNKSGDFVTYARFL